MRVGNHSLQASILASSTELKRIRTLTDYPGIPEQIKPLQHVGRAAETKFESHRLCRDSWADKAFTTCWSGCRIQVWVQVWAAACHLAITPKGCLRRIIEHRKVLAAKSMAELLGQCSATAWAGLTCKHKHRAFPSLQQSPRAATSSL